MINCDSDRYPSRKGGEARRLPRRDPVVYSTASSPLDAVQLLRYQHEGYIQHDDVFSPSEVAAFRRAVTELCEAEELRGRPELIREPDGVAVRSIFRPHDLHPVLGNLVRDPRLVRMAEQILGSRVYIHQSRVNFKPAFLGKEFFWHSDFETWHVEDGMPAMRALSISISLTDNTEFNGPLMVIPGSHRTFVACAGETPEEHYKQSLRRQHYGTPDLESLQTLARELGIASPKGGAGSIVAFDCNLLHASGSNLSPHPRCNLFVVYNSIANCLGAPFAGLSPRPEFIAAREFQPI